MFLPQTPSVGRAEIPFYLVELCTVVKLCLRIFPWSIIPWSYVPNLISQEIKQSTHSPTYSFFLKIKAKDN